MPASDPVPNHLIGLATWRRVRYALDVHWEECCKPHRGTPRFYPRLIL